MGAVVGFIALGAVIVGVGRWVEPKVSWASQAELAASYRRRFFLRIAYANAPVLLMFVVGSASGATATFAFAALFAIVGYSHAIPSARRLAREDAALSERGCRWSLLRALQNGAKPFAVSHAKLGMCRRSINFVSSASAVTSSCPMSSTSGSSPRLTTRSMRWSPPIRPR
jgi:hypothetical protein